MRFGMTESRTRQILVEEMKRVGLEDGDGLVLFGGELTVYQTSPISL